MSDEDRLADLLLQWEELRDQGMTISATDLCRDCLELMPKLQQQIDALKAMDWLNRDASQEAAGDNSADYLTTPPEFPRTLSGRYRLDRLIGEGGFGQVWEGYDLELLRKIAIKLAKAEGSRSGEIFLAEARKLAQLRHPGIISVHDIGRDGNTTFIISDLIEGADLAHFLRRQRPAPKEIARMAAEAADALHYAHQHGFIHRDLKPANLLVDHHGSVFIADFGIAWTDADPPLQASRVGTAAYMSPEQVAGEDRLDARTDIYSLGVVLYEMLAGRLPFHADNPVTLREQILFQSPPPLCSTGPTMAKRLGRVCLKCLAKNPADRYATAQDLANDIKALGQHRFRMGRLPRRKAMLFFCVCLPMLFAVVLLVRQFGEKPSNPHPSAVLEEIRKLPGHTGPITGVVISPDGQRAVSCSEDRTLRVWDLKSGEETCRLTAESAVFCIAVSPDGRQALSGGGNGVIQLWDLRTGRELGRLVGHNSLVHSVAFSPDGLRALSCSIADDLTVRLWDIRERKELRHLVGHRHNVNAVQFSVDGNSAYSGSSDRTIRRWDLRTGSEQVCYHFPCTVLNFVLSHDGATIAASGGAGMVQLLEPEGPLKAVSCVGHSADVRGISFCPGDNCLLTAAEDQTVRLWDVKAGVERYHEQVTCGVRCLVISPDGHYVLSGGQDGSLVLWRFRP